MKCFRLPILATLFIGISTADAQPPAAKSVADTRNIATGLPIPSEGYADQPYIVKTDDGAWRGSSQTSESSEFRMELLERQVSLLVPQSWRFVHRTHDSQSTRGVHRQPLR